MNVDIVQNRSEMFFRVVHGLEAAKEKVSKLSVFVGLDGFVDDILHAVDKRESADCFTRIPSIEHLARRLSAAVRVGTNLELVSDQTKLGGNGPIMANALANFGLKVTYLGALGYPAVHPVFADFAEKVQAHSIAQPGFTDALEFEDGKIMLNKNESLQEVNWANIGSRYGHVRFDDQIRTASLVGFVNWTMLPHMSAIWEAIQKKLLPIQNLPKRKIFFDLADPQKRADKDIRHALDLIVRFGENFDVILGLNEKEAHEIGRVLGLEITDRSKSGLVRLVQEISRRVPVKTLVVHPTAYALAVSDDSCAIVDGPFITAPKITTGAGDHFNAGFCLGKLLGLDDELSLLCGVSTSGYYVRTASSPTMDELTRFIASNFERVNS